jgi:hypothetical protein
MKGRKARPAAPLKARDRSGVAQLCSDVGTEATPDILDAIDLLWHDVPRLHLFFEAFDAEMKSIGIFATLKEAADAIARAAGGDHD